MGRLPGTRLSVALVLLAALAAQFTACDGLSGFSQWPTYTLVFHANGGQGSMGSVTRRHGEYHYIPANAFTHTGHNFEGWARSPGGEKEFYAGQQVVGLGTRAAGDTINLFALWDMVGFVITFDANGGDGNAPAPVTLDAGEGITLPDQGWLYKYRHTFGGWITGAGTPYRAGSRFTPAGDVTFYAVWHPYGTYFVVSFAANGGSGNAPAPMPVAGGVTLPDQGGLSKYRHTFGGWLAESGTPYRAGSRFTPIGDVTLMAVWHPYGTVFTVMFAANGGSGNGPPPLSVGAGEIVTLPNQHGFSRTGHTFGGWNTMPDGAGDGYGPGAPFSTYVDATLYATWVAESVGGDWVQFCPETGAITGFRGVSRSITIPPVINGVTVAAIGEGAFMRNHLTGVVIPGGVVSIGLNAFAENPLTSIGIPSGVNIANGSCMGLHGDAFLAVYNGNGRLAGVYAWDGAWRIHGDAGHGSAVFSISFSGFADLAAGMDAHRSVGVLDRPATIGVGGGFDQVRWVHDGEIVQGATGASIDFSALHGNRMGLHFVTVEVRAGGRWYSHHIGIVVTR